MANRAGTLCSRGGSRKAQLRPRDTLVIRVLDRVADEERMAIEIIRELGMRGMWIKSLTEPFLNVGISTPMGEATLGNMAVMAQLCVSMIRENTHRGLAHARAQRKPVGGRMSWMKTHRHDAAAARGKELCADRQDSWCQRSEYLPLSTEGKPMIHP